MEIAQLLESALENNRSGLKQAAMRSVSRLPPETSLREVLLSDAGDAIRGLTLSELGDALTERSPRRVVATDAPTERDASREEMIYRRILEQLASGPMTIGQLAKSLDLEADELRGYLGWMRDMGKIQTSGRARATRYQLAAY